MKNLVVLSVIVSLILALGGCMTNRVKSDLGTSLRQMISSQRLNKETEKNLDPVTGLDGQAASIIMEEYRESFTAEKKIAEIPELAPGLDEDEEDE